MTLTERMVEAAARAQREELWRWEDEWNRTHDANGRRIAARDDVRKAQDVARNGLAERLSDMLDAARERTMHMDTESAP